MAHTRAVSGANSPETAEAVSASRRLLKEGRIEESVSRLKELTARTPGSLEVRRALRSASRELRRRQEPPDAEPDDFPELAVTFQVPPTRRDEAETLLQPTLLRPAGADGATISPTPPASGPAEPARTLAWAGAAALAVALGAGVFLLTRDRASLPAAGSPAPSAPPAATLLAAPAPAPVEAVAAALTILKVVSDPEGATVALDGRPLDGATPMTLQIDAGSDHTLTVGAEGHATAEVRLSPGRVPPEVRVTLQPAGPSGRVQVSSFYPVDVLWKGKIVARAQPSPQFSLPAGRQTVTLVSSTYFLRLDVPVQVRGGSVAAVDAPPLGKLNIRANPDNCEVFVDGSFVDYPPILDRAVAAGTHTVAFKWPDGTRREEAVEVSRGAHAYVMGRKE
jgi:hypothetical protein